MIETKEILSNLGHAALTPMQQAMLEASGTQGAVVLLSPTGSGKTLAYLLPLVQSLNVESDALQAVVVVPSRELALQSDEVVRGMKCGVRSLCLYGGRPAMEEHRRLREVRPQLVFATPGRLVDHLEKENLLPLTVTTLVIDEFDKCLELGFHDDMARLAAAFSRTERLRLTSATDADEIPAFLSRMSGLKAGEAVRLNYLAEAEEVRRRMELFQVASPEKDKLATLGRLLTYLKGAPAIVFAAHRESAERIGKYLKGEGFTAVVYHGGMEQEWRERALYKFRSGGANVLVATDLAARGLDIPEVEAVVHYHLPLTEDAFTHRSGRTARWEASGRVFLITGPTENLPEFVAGAEALGVDELRIKPHAPKWATIYIGRGKKDKLGRIDIVGFFCKKGGLRGDDLGRIDVGAHYAYAAVRRSKLKELLNRVGGEKIKGMKTIIEEMKY